MTKLRKAEAALAWAEGALLAALLTAMIALSFLQVVLRQAFETGLLWADPLLRHLVLWVGFLGAGLAAADGKHFAWEPAAHKGGRTGAILKLVANVAAVAITGVLIRASLGFFSDEREAGDVLFTLGSLGVPAWIFSAIIPIGFVLIALHLAVRAAEAAAALRGGGNAS